MKCSLYSLVCVLLVCLALCGPCWAADTQSGSLLTHITFVSGNREQNDQSFWSKRIASKLIEQYAAADDYTPTPPHTDMLLWLGDALYADVSDSGVELAEAGQLSLITTKYRAMRKENNAYQHFINSRLHPPRGRVIGVWDGHDIGLRTANASYPHLAAVKDLYLENIFTSDEDRAAVRLHKGLYHFTNISAPAGSRLARHFVSSVCTITLDLYTFREAMPDLSAALLHPYVSTSSHNFSIWHDQYMLLGQEQWEWLNRIAQHYLADAARAPDGRRWCALTLLASPWQVLLNDNKPFLGWDLYPGARSRLLALLQHYRVARLVFLSGHAESAELGRLRQLSPQRHAIRDRGRNSAYPFAATRAAATLLPPYPSYLVELTSSGLTHSITETAYVGWLYRTLVPTDNEREWDTTGRMYEELPVLMPRYVDLTRDVGLERNFGTVTLRDTDPHGNTNSSNMEEEEDDAHRVMRTTEVTITVHAMRQGNALVEYTATLDDLPTYEHVNTSNSSNNDPLAFNATQFYLYNIPGEYPGLKRMLLRWQCAELPCVPGRFRVFGAIAFTLSIAFVVIVLLFLGILYCSPDTSGEPEVLFIRRPRKVKVE